VADPTTTTDALAARSTAAGDTGLTPEGFLPKPFARLLDEKLTLVRELLDEELDLGPASPVRKLLELSALEDARTWAALAAIYDGLFVPTATGDSLSRLGEELGLLRPYLEAQGNVRLTLQGTLPPGQDRLVIPRGARMLTRAGDDAATDEDATFGAGVTVQDIRVVAFRPGPDSNLNPADPDRRLSMWNLADDALTDLVEAAKVAPGLTVAIEHTSPLTGGEGQWPDVRYRELLLRAPRSVWTADAMRIAAALVPGVRQVQVRDAWGGLDIHQSIFGTLDVNYIERLFSDDPGSTSPYQLTVLVAPTPAAIWEGPNGLRNSVLAAVKDVRPPGIAPNVQQATEVRIGVAASLDVRGLALPAGTAATINSSPPALALKARLSARLRRYIDGLDFGEPVRIAEVTTALMEEPSVVDAFNLRLLKFPPSVTTLGERPEPELIGGGRNVQLEPNEIAVFVEDNERLWI
jgi:hypothetical protein